MKYFTQIEGSQEIEILLSSKRVSVYKKVDINNWFAEYKKDIELGKHLYEKLHFLEVFLRNKIDYEFQKVFGSDWLNNVNQFPFHTTVLTNLMKLSKRITKFPIFLLAFGLGFFTHIITTKFGIKILAC